MDNDAVFSVRRAEASDVDACLNVAAELSDYFTPDTHDEIRTSIPRDLAWVATADTDASSVLGFVVAEQRYAQSAEITFAAVRPSHRRRGIGTLLIDRALGELADRGVLLVEAKTLDASAGYDPYVATRAFWQSRGFIQIDRIDPLPGWQPGNPSAILVAALDRTR